MCVCVSGRGKTNIFDEIFAVKVFFSSSFGHPANRDLLVGRKVDQTQRAKFNTILLIKTPKREREEKKKKTCYIFVGAKMCSMLSIWTKLGINLFGHKDFVGNIIGVRMPSEK
jgi:hypothetical protein